LFSSAIANGDRFVFGADFLRSLFVRAEIEQFKREKAQRDGAAAVKLISDDICACRLLRLPQRSPLPHMNRIGRRTIMCVLLIRCFGICSANSRQYPAGL
jgi:hypothetical protein